MLWCIVDDADSCDDSLHDPDYEPATQSDVSSDENDTQEEANIQDDTDAGNADVEQLPVEVTAAARGRKRVRHVELWKRNIRKRLRNSGKEYIGVNKKVKRAKLFMPTNCSCRFKCSEHIPENVQESTFLSFWKLGSFELQTGFVLSCAVASGPKRPSKHAQKHKQCSHSFTLNGHRVCRYFFRRTLGISEGRLHRCLLRKRSVVPCVSDNRGKHRSHHTVVSANQLADIRSHIQSFPRYRSHYCRRDSVNRTYYLNPDLNLSIMYNLYVDSCKENNKAYVKKWCYRKIFNEEFNISFHKPSTDTCSYCDRWQSVIDHDSDDTTRKQAQNEKQVHLRRADVARDSYKADISGTEEHKKCIVFDLQKTLPTPHLNTSKVFYMRQLWTYNLAIHDSTSDTAYMHMWDETQGSRGSQEVASCLLHYCRSVPASVTHITAYSDCCGGQNRNENIALTWMYIVQSNDYSIASVDHKFFEPGHSYNVCDQDFGLIEKKKRRVENVWTPEGWQNLVAKSSKKFNIIKMDQKEMKSLEAFRKTVTCRKKATDGSNLEWLKLRWMHFENASPFMMFFKPTLQAGYDFREVSFGKVGRPAALPKLGPLYTEERALKLAKVKDLQSLLVFVPPLHHAFYKSIKAESKDTDDTVDTDTDYEEGSTETRNTSNEPVNHRKCQSARLVQKKAGNAEKSRGDKFSKKRKLQSKGLEVAENHASREADASTSSEPVNHRKRQAAGSAQKKAGNAEKSSISSKKIKLQSKGAEVAEDHASRGSTNSSKPTKNDRVQLQKCVTKKTRVIRKPSRLTDFCV